MRNKEQGSRSPKNSEGTKKHAAAFSTCQGSFSGEGNQMFSAFFGLVGALLGQRFSAWSLLPTTVLALVCTAGAGAAEGARVPSILVAMFGVCTALQFGYVAGICATELFD